MAGSAMPTTVASRAAMPEPSTVAVTTHRPGAVDIRRAGLPAYGAARLAHGLVPRDTADGGGAGTHHGPFGIIRNPN